MGNIVDEVSRYLYRHITRITGFEEDIDEAYDSTLKLSMALSKVRTHRPFYIILDGFVDLLTLNKDGRYQFAEYLFSFSYIPHNVKFVFSCRSDNLEYITKTCIPYLCFKRMGMNKFKAVIEKNLSDVGKRLPSKQKSQILKSSIGDNVFMLTVFFELLKNYGSFDSIDNDILSLFEIHSQDQFVLQYIERMDIVYPEIKIKRIIGILLSSKCGFTENELAALSNINQINVSIFRSIMKPFLSIVNGRIRISSNIINKMEFAISECRQIILDVIGEFYQNTSKKHRQLRAIYGLELSWQYYIQKNYKKLREILLDWRNFIYFYENHLEYLVQLWRCLESLKDPDYSLKLYQIDLFTFDCPPKDLKVFDTYLTKLISNYFYDNNYVFDQMTNISVALEIYKETENNIVRNSRFSELLEKLQIGRTLSNNDYVGREVLLEIINSTSSKRKKLGYMLLYLDASIAYCDIYHSKYSYRDINEDDEDNRGVYNTKMLFLKDVIKDVNYYGICKNPLVQIKVAKIWIILAECQRRLHKSRNALCSVNMALKILSRYRTNHLCEFTVAEAIALQTSAFIYADLRKTNKAIARSLLSIERWNNLHTMHGHKFRIQHVDAIISLGIIYAMDYEYFESSREFSRAWRILDKEYFYEDQSDIMLQKQHEIERLQMKQGLYEYSEKDAERFERCAERNNRMDNFEYQLINYSKALCLRKESMEYNTNIHENEIINAIVDDYMEIAEALFQKEEYVLAISKYQQALDYLQDYFDISENGTQICASKCYHEIAECYYFIKKYKKAECYYFKALHIWEKCQDVCSEDYAELFSSLGYTYYMMNNSELACNYFRKSYEIQKKSQMNCNMKVIEEILKELSANNIQE